MGGGALSHDRQTTVVAKADSSPQERPLTNIDGEAWTTAAKKMVLSKTGAADRDGTGYETEDGSAKKVSSPPPLPPELATMMATSEVPTGDLNDPSQTGSKNLPSPTFHDAKDRTQKVSAGDGGKVKIETPRRRRGGRSLPERRPQASGDHQDSPRAASRRDSNPCVGPWCGGGGNGVSVIGDGDGDCPMRGGKKRPRPPAPAETGWGDQVFLPSVRSYGINVNSRLDDPLAASPIGEDGSGLPRGGQEMVERTGTLVAGITSSGVGADCYDVREVDDDDALAQLSLGAAPVAPRKIIQGARVKDSTRSTLGDVDRANSVGNGRGDKGLKNRIKGVERDKDERERLLTTNSSPPSPGRRERSPRSTASSRRWLPLVGVVEVRGESGEGEGEGEGKGKGELGMVEDTIGKKKRQRRVLRVSVVGRDLGIGPDALGSCRGNGEVGRRGRASKDGAGKRTAAAVSVLGRRRTRMAGGGDDDGCDDPGDDGNNGDAGEADGKRLSRAMVMTSDVQEGASSSPVVGGRCRAVIIAAKERDRTARSIRRPGRGHRKHRGGVADGSVDDVGGIKERYSFRTAIERAPLASGTSAPAYVRTEDGVLHPPERGGRGLMTDEDFVRENLLVVVRKIRSRVDKFGFFSGRVDPIAAECPDYYDVIDPVTEAMDLDTMEGMIIDGTLCDMDNFERYLDRIVICAKKYNTDDDNFVRCEAERIWDLATPLLDSARRKLKRRGRGGDIVGEANRATAQVAPGENTREEATESYEAEVPLERRIVREKRGQGQEHRGRRSRGNGGRNSSGGSSNAEEDVDVGETRVMVADSRPVAQRRKSLQQIRGTEAEAVEATVSSSDDGSLNIPLSSLRKRSREEGTTRRDSEMNALTPTVAMGGARASPIRRGKRQRRPIRPPVQKSVGLTQGEGDGDRNSCGGGSPQLRTPRTSYQKRRSNRGSVDKVTALPQQRKRGRPRKHRVEEKHAGDGDGGTLPPGFADRPGLRSKSTAASRTRRSSPTAMEKGEASIGGVRRRKRKSETDNRLEEEDIDTSDDNVILGNKAAVGLGLRRKRPAAQKREGATAHKRGGSTLLNETNDSDFRMKKDSDGSSSDGDYSSNSLPSSLSSSPSSNREVSSSEAGVAVRWSRCLVRERRSLRKAAQMGHRKAETKDDGLSDSDHLPLRRIATRRKIKSLNPVLPVKRRRGDEKGSLSSEPLVSAAVITTMASLPSAVLRRKRLERGGDRVLKKDVAPSFPNRGHHCGRSANGSDIDDHSGDNHDEQPEGTEGRDIPSCIRGLSSSTLTQCNSREKWVSLAPAMVIVCNEAARRATLRSNPDAESYDKPLSEVYLKERLEYDDPLWGHQDHP